ncbi:protein FANTASTIC FOUR 1-like [Durio zibethinus]|uniref:Protein FANTASTIC FOUR 1-like n=1 Tax=Durio zibethinus TaxID=66656 RepID=A0A6P5XW93_DURZI|nr:protein FANTASTIC FOUR 1-like [Durio zibethinus]
MAACGSLHHIFENPLPENTTLIDSLSSWNQIKPAIKPSKQSSFTEIFGELHFKENSQSSSASSFPISPFSHTSIIGLNPQNSTFKLSRNDTFHENDENNRSTSPPELFSSTPKIIMYTGNWHEKSESFSLNSERLQLCTEGLGFESFDDVEDMKNEMKEDWESKEKKASSINTTKHTTTKNFHGELRTRSKASIVGAFPPPISCIGKSGKPWVCFKSYRQDGRFVLKEVRIPTQEFLHACREDGRLKLQFVQPNDEILEEEEFGKEEDEVEDLESEGLINDDIDEGKEKRQP